MPKFSLALLLLLLLLSLPHALPAHPAATSVVQASIQLAGTSSAHCEASFTLLSTSYSGEVNLDPTSQTLNFWLHSQAEMALPPNTVIARISVHDLHTGTVTEFQVRTDSGGVMVIISDF